MAISKADLLNAPDLATSVVEVEGLGEVRLRELTTAQRLTFMESFSTDADDRTATDNVRANLRFVVQSLVDDDDAPLFGPDEIDEGVEALMERPIDQVMALISAGLSASGIGEDEVKGEVGNSESDRN